MTIGTQISQVTVEGNGVTTAFTYPFLMPAAADAVITYTAVGGAQTVLLPSQYTITGVGDSTGGTVTYPLAGSPIQSGSLLTIQRLLPLIQTTSISNQGPTFAAIENELDYLTMLAQQIQAEYSRTIQLNPADINPMPVLPPAAQRAGQLLGFDSNGNPIVTQPTGVPVSAAMQPVVAAPTVSAAAALMGVGQVFNILDTNYAGGADPTGVANSTAAIQAAINAAAAAGGGIVWVPAGTFRTTSTVTLSAGVCLWGVWSTSYFEESDFIQVSTIIWSGATGGTLLAGGNQYNGSIKNLVLDGAYIAANILQLGAPQNSEFENLVVTRTSSGMAKGSGISIDITGQTVPGGGPVQQSGNNTFKNVIVRDMHYVALYALGMTSCTFVNCNFQTFAGASAAAPCVVLDAQCDSNQWFGGVISLDAGAIGGECLVLNFSTTNDDVFGNNFYGTVFGTVDGTATCIDARNNQTFNHFFGCYLPNQGTILVTTNGTGSGQVKFWGCQFSSVGQNFTNPISETLGSSPYVFRNGPNSGQQLECILQGGTVSDVSIIRNAVTASVGALGANTLSLLLEPGDGIKLTFTAPPFLLAVPH